MAPPDPCMSREGLWGRQVQGGKVESGIYETEHFRSRPWAQHDSMLDVSVLASHVGEYMFDDFDNTKYIVDCSCRKIISVESEGFVD